MRLALPHFSRWAVVRVSSPYAFVCALVVVALWAVAGPFVGFSDIWMLVINTLTTIVTFLLGFLILAAQKHDSAALHLKLDELLRAQADARTALTGAEDRDEAFIERERDAIREERDAQAG